jgi:hypothetical protein
MISVMIEAEAIEMAQRSCWGPVTAMRPASTRT